MQKLKYHFVSINRWNRKRRINKTVEISSQNTKSAVSDMLRQFYEFILSQSMKPLELYDDNIIPLFSLHTIHPNGEENLMKPMDMEKLETKMEVSAIVQMFGQINNDMDQWGEGLKIFHSLYGHEAQQAADEAIISIYDRLPFDFQQLVDSYFKRERPHPSIYIPLWN